MGKNANGEGTIVKRKDGRYEGRYWVHTAEGPKRKSIYGRKGERRKEVRRRLNEALVARDGGLVFDSGSLTVGAYLDRWLADSARDAVKPVTFEGYARTVRLHAKPALGRIKLDKLTPAHLRGLYREKLDGAEGSPGLSPRSVRLLHFVLRRALKQAVRDGLVPRNPCEAVDPPQDRKKEVRPLSPQQANALLRTAESSGNRLEALYVLAVHCGLRQGELLALRWEDLDADGGLLRVRRTLSTAKGAGKDNPRFTEPKTRKARRAVGLTPPALSALAAHRKRQLEERMKLANKWEDHGLIFPSLFGTPMSRHNLTRSFKKLLERAGLPHTTRFHDLRHTCATLLLSQNHNPKFVQELLGHATIAVTLDTYSHVIPGMADHASAIEKALATPQT